MHCLVCCPGASLIDLHGGELIDVDRTTVVAAAPGVAISAVDGDVLHVPELAAGATVRAIPVAEDCVGLRIGETAELHCPHKAPRCISMMAGSDLPLDLHLQKPSRQSIPAPAALGHIGERGCRWGAD